MTQANEFRHRLKAAFASKIAEGAGAAEVAAVATRAFAAITLNLTPVIGRAGVVALYRRSIHLASLTYPWLNGSVPGAADMAALETMLAEHGVADAAEAGTAVLQTFCELLASLVGIALTDRLLHSVWADL